MLNDGAPAGQGGVWVQDLDRGLQFLVLEDGGGQAALERPRLHVALEQAERRRVDGLGALGGTVRFRRAHGGRQLGDGFLGLGRCVLDLDAEVDVRLQVARLDVLAHVVGGTAVGLLLLADEADELALAVGLLLLDEAAHRVDLGALGDAAVEQRLVLDAVGRGGLQVGGGLDRGVRGRWRFCRLVKLT